MGYGKNVELDQQKKTGKMKITWEEQCRKPPMNGNGIQTTYDIDKNNDLGDGL